MSLSDTNKYLSKSNTTNEYSSKSDTNEYSSKSDTTNEYSSKSDTTNEYSSKSNTTNEYSSKSDTTEYVDLLRAGCSEICNTDLKGSKSLYFDEIKKKVDCIGIWKNTDIDKPRSGPAPSIPPEMMQYFSYGGRIKILPFSSVLIDEVYLGKSAKTPIWDYNTIEEWKGKCTDGTLHGTYGVHETSRLFRALKIAKGVRNGRVLVIGSEIPWVEACVLAAGASAVVTLEYGNIQSLHPQVNTYTPDEMRHQFVSGNISNFDAVVTFSSIEHSGLGRYGDSLNPWGDLQALARAWCISKSGASLVLAVPDSEYSVPDDAIMFNAHRVYGPLLFSHLLANWKQLWRDENGGGIRQRIHVLQKVD